MNYNICFAIQVPSMNYVKVWHGTNKHTTYDVCFALSILKFNMILLACYCGRVLLDPRVAMLSD
jgi:hypothetical protein